jgi:hypothetical protein
MVLSTLAVLPLLMSAAPVAHPAPGAPGFRLIVLQKTWGELGLGYKHEPALTKLREAL